LKKGDVPIRGKNPGGQNCKYVCARENDSRKAATRRRSLRPPSSESWGTARLQDAFGACNWALRSKEKNRIKTAIICFAEKTDLKSDIAIGRGYNLYCIVHNKVLRLRKSPVRKNETSDRKRGTRVGRGEQALQHPPGKRATLFGGERDSRGRGR